MSPRTIFTIVGVFVGIWAVLGFMDVGNQSFTGYGTDSDDIVDSVAEEGPAAAAGMEIGDRIQSIDGIDIDDSDAFAELPRRTVGQTHTIAVDRAGQSVELSLTRTAPPSVAPSYLVILMGLCFAGMGLWAFFTMPTAATRILATFGGFFGFVLTSGPYLGTAFIADVTNFLVLLSIFMAFATLLHFALVFPNKTAPNLKLLYGPVGLVVLLGLADEMFNPGTDSAFSRIMLILIPGVIFGYLGLALFKLLRTWAGASPTDRSRHGLTLIAAGTGGPLALLLVIALLGIFDVNVPGVNWIIFTIVLIPVTCALAAVKSGRAGGEAAVD